MDARMDWNGLGGRADRGPATREERTALVPVLLLIGSAGALLLSQLFSSVLPAKYFYDAAKLKTLVTTGQTVHDKSFDNIALILRTTSVSEGMLQFVVLALFSAAIWKVAGLVPDQTSVSKMLGGIAMCYVVCSVYLMRYSKEFVVILLVLLLIRLSPRLTGDALLVVTILFYGYYFRPYWSLVALAYSFLRLCTLRWPSTRAAISGFFLVCAGVAVALRIKFGDADIFREAVNVARTSSPDARTALGRIAPFGGISGDGANAIATLALLIFPLPLLLQSGAVFAIIGLGLALIWLGFFRGFRTLNWGDQLPLNIVRLRGACLILALLAIQAQFEPDLGSALRHISPVLPLVLLISCGGEPAKQRKAEAYGPKSVALRRQGLRR